LFGAIEILRISETLLKIMADPIGATASIITLLDLCVKVLKYLRDVKDGPKDCNRLKMEISSTRGLLETLKETIEDAESAPQEGWSATIRSLNNDEGPLKQLEETLITLHDAFSRAAAAKGLDKISKRFLWPFKKDDAENLIKNVDRQKLLLILALENDHIALSKEIQRDTRTVRDGIDRLIHSQEDQDRQAIIDWLTPIEYAAQQTDIISKRQEGTGEWLLKSSEFQEWVNKSQQTLFCPGIPGAGKTVMSSIVVDQLNAKFKGEAGVGIAHIYCSYQPQQEQKTEDLILSLLKQLAQKHMIVNTEVKTLYERHRTRGSRPSMDEIARALQSTVQLYSRVFFIIDALDEFYVSNNEEQKRLLSEIFGLQKQAQINLFATSRFISEIISQFERCSSKEIRAQNDDILSYVNGRIPRLLKSRISNYPDYAHLQSTIGRDIVKAADGMYVDFSVIM
jgi:hypothetical protein